MVIPQDLGFHLFFRVLVIVLMQLMVIDIVVLIQFVYRLHGVINIYLYEDNSNEQSISDQQQ